MKFKVGDKVKVNGPTWQNGVPAKLIAIVVDIDKNDNTYYLQWINTQTCSSNWFESEIEELTPLEAVL